MLPWLTEGPLAHIQLPAAIIGCGVFFIMSTFAYMGWIGIPDLPRDIRSKRIERTKLYFSLMILSLVLGFYFYLVAIGFIIIRGYQSYRDYCYATKNPNNEY